MSMMCSMSSTGARCYSNLGLKLVRAPLSRPHQVLLQGRGIVVESSYGVMLCIMCFFLHEANLQTADACSAGE